MTGVLILLLILGTLWHNYTVRCFKAEVSVNKLMAIYLKVSFIKGDIDALESIFGKEVTIRTAEAILVRHVDEVVKSLK